MRWPAIAVLAAGLAATAVGCGDDDQEGSRWRTPRKPRARRAAARRAGLAARVELTATVFREGQRLSFEYTLANTGSEPIALVDTLAVMDQLEPLDGGAYRIVYARTTADAAAGSPSPLPDQQGKLVTPDGSAGHGRRVTGDWDKVPAEVELCIEVVPPPWTGRRRWRRRSRTGHRTPSRRWPAAVACPCPDPCRSQRRPQRPDSTMARLQGRTVARRRSASSSPRWIPRRHGPLVGDPSTRSRTSVPAGGEAVTVEPALGR